MNPWLVGIASVPFEADTTVVVIIIIITIIIAAIYKAPPSVVLLSFQSPQYDLLKCLQELS